METEENVFPVQSPVAEEAAALVSVVQPSPRQQSINPATSSCLGLSEINLRLLCTVFCIAVLITAAITLEAINKVEDNLDDNSSIYANADGYKRAATWLVVIAVMVIVFQSLIIFIRYLYLRAVLPQSFFRTYAYLDAALCALFGLSFFAGGVANAIYAVNNAETIKDIGNTCADQSNDVCDAIKRVRDSEAAAASMSFLLMMIFVILMIIMISSGILKSQEAERESDDSSSSTTSDAADSPSNLPSHTPLNPPPYTQIGAPPPYSP